MSGSRGPQRRRRRRRHTTSLTRTPEQLRKRHRRSRLSAPEALACVGLGLICATLIALIWITTQRAVGERYQDTRARAEAAVTAQAATLAIQVQHELLMIDQSLAVLQSAWDANPDAFNLDDWRKRMPALTAVSDDLFIANDRHVIIQDIIPAAVGQGIGSAYANFATGSLEPINLAKPGSNDALVIGELGDTGVVRQYLMYLIRPLTRPTGWLIGASYRSQALTDVFAAAGLGHEGLAALVDTHRGGIQALVGLAAVRPRLSIANSPMYQAMIARPDGGIWIGRTAIDGIPRILAFRRVPDRDLVVLVGVSTSEAMAPAASWAEGAQSVAGTATLLVLAITVAVMWEVWNWRRTRRRQRALGQAEALLSSLQSELAAMRLRTAANTVHLRAILDGVSEGLAVFDGEHRLATWNPGFTALCGLPADALREGLPLDELLRRQAEAGQFGVLEDVQSEVDRRMALLRPDTPSARIEIAETAPDGTPRVLWAEPAQDGSLVLVLRGTVSTQPVAPGAEVAMAAVAEQAGTAGGAMEW